MHGPGADGGAGGQEAGGGGDLRGVEHVPQLPLCLCGPLHVPSCRAAPPSPPTSKFRSLFLFLTDMTLPPPSLPFPRRAGRWPRTCRPLRRRRTVVVAATVDVVVIVAAATAATTSSTTNRHTCQTRAAGVRLVARRWSRALVRPPRRARRKCTRAGARALAGAGLGLRARPSTGRTHHAHVQATAGPARAGRRPTPAHTHRGGPGGRGPQTT
jgi:hypothetical protein